MNPPKTKFEAQCHSVPKPAHYQSALTADALHSLTIRFATAPLAAAMPVISGVYASVAARQAGERREMGARAATAKVLPR